MGYPRQQYTIYILLKVSDTHCFNYRKVVVISIRIIPESKPSNNINTDDSQC